MPVTAVIGGQWGDEGKGAIVDRLAEDAHIIARYQGGPNAGHTLCVGDRKFVLHQIPSGIVRPDKICVLGAGMVVDPIRLVEEIEMLKNNGIDVTDRLYISPKAHIIMPIHRVFDGLMEASRGGKIGTTGRGIGPAYATKVYRVGLRAGELTLRNFSDKTAEVLGSLPHDVSETLKREFPNWAEALLAACASILPYVHDTHTLIHRNLDKQILAEGGQGALLDIDHGSYPYVTSSSTGTGGVLSGLGIGPSHLTRVIGVFKAYLTRVGEGPFPTEIQGLTADNLRAAGNEFGATTGRPRRVGWFDIPLSKYACEINGFTEIALTKLDVLAEFAHKFPDQDIKIGMEYEKEYSRDEIEEASEIIGELHSVSVKYNHFGFKPSDKPITELPESMRNYIEKIKLHLSLPVTMVSLGPERSQMVFI